MNRLLKNPLQIILNIIKFEKKSKAMKIAFCGKGEVGKSILATILSLVFLEEGYKVLAIDADPSPHLTRLYLTRLFGIE